MDFKGKKVAIMGWGINGLDSYNFLVEQDCEITIYDKKEKNDLDLSQVDVKKVKIVTGTDYLEDGVKGYNYIFRAPGVYRFLPEIVEAEKEGSVITSVTKLFFDLCLGNIIGVTGTKGKGTTSTLIYKILKQAGKDIYLAGNIGTPMLSLLPKSRPSSWVVLELSSFQLIDLEKSPHIAVVLNITTDHLDWHKDRKEYIEAKTNIVKHQSKSDFAVLAKDYKDSSEFSSLTEAEVCYFSNSRKVKGSFIRDGEIIIETGEKKVSVGKTKDLLLRGEHNWENVCAASCASYLAGASFDSIKKATFSFNGLEHRLELVGEFNGIKFYDDSFSTNSQTTIAAVRSFDEPTTLILGGFDKGLNYDDMAKVIGGKRNIENIILIGNISEKLKKSLKKEGVEAKIIKLGKPTMKAIVDKGLEITPPGGVILLSPASSSFDMFTDYKDRGNQFKKAVRLLKSNAK